MKKLIYFAFTLILIFSMSACNVSETLNQTNAPGSSGTSKPTSQEPPVLKIMDNSCISIEANTGTYCWSYDNGDGTQTGVCADSSHPLEWKEFLLPMVTSDDTVELYFSVQPQEFTIRCWSDIHWGKVDTVEEAVTIDGNTLELKQGGYIYEVVAKWTGETIAAQGTVHYGFYAIYDDHDHSLAEEPQTVDDPAIGYCGNTITTVHLDGNAYSFYGSDSVNLTDILINLKYDPNKICRCMPEFSVDTEFGTSYGVNLSQSYARCEEGQADLTSDQVDLIQEVLNNQT